MSLEQWKKRLSLLSSIPRKGKQADWPTGFDRLIQCLILSQLSDTNYFHWQLCSLDDAVWKFPLPDARDVLNSKDNCDRSGMWANLRLRREISPSFIFVFFFFVTHLDSVSWWSFDRRIILPDRWTWYSNLHVQLEQFDRFDECRATQGRESSAQKRLINSIYLCRPWNLIMNNVFDVRNI